jgi:Ca2+/Na+ antiporter
MLLAATFFGLYVIYLMLSTVLGALGTLCLVAAAALFYFKKKKKINAPSKAPIALLVAAVVLLPIGVHHRLSLDDADAKQVAADAQKRHVKSEALDALVTSRCGAYPYVPKEMLNVAHTVQDYNNSVGAYTNSADHLESALAERKQRYSECEDRVRKENM